MHEKVLCALNAGAIATVKNLAMQKEVAGQTVEVQCVVGLAFLAKAVRVVGEAIRDQRIRVQVCVGSALSQRQSRARQVDFEKPIRAAFATVGVEFRAVLVEKLFADALLGHYKGRHTLDTATQVQVESETIRIDDNFI